MQLTAEQHSIISSSGNIKINAVAGSGKTTTIIEYARTRPANSKILYLAFNRSVKLEAEKKFSDKGIKNVKVETGHSLAYKHVVFKHNYQVKADKYKTYELAELLSISRSGEKHFEHILANHVNKFAAYYCNSEKTKLEELNYRDVVSDKKAKTFVNNYYDYIERYTRLFLHMMETRKAAVTHDFYLKKFQLSKPVLNFDYILFDEGQDASPAMLDVFLQQKATKVIVGDTHQQIYGWRYAVNSLEKVNYPAYYLSTSFRFHQDIARLATEVLERKKHLKEHERVTINGTGKNEQNKTKAVLGRTNLGLLVQAIDFVKHRKNFNHLYFEGNINSYTYANEGASLYDVLNLYNGNHGSIKDKLIKSMKNLTELEEYIDKTEDVQLGMLVELVIDYGNKLPGIIRKIKEKHVADGEKDKAEIIFSTIHRSKGMEYDHVMLANDFLTEEKLLKIKKETGEEEIDINKLNEEINLLYVAITRTKNVIRIPKALLPKNFPVSNYIAPIDTEVETKPQVVRKKTKPAFPERKEKEYSVEKIREKHSQAYESWTGEQDDELTEMFCTGISVLDLSLHFGRTKGAIRSRIKKLELEEKYM